MAPGTRGHTANSTAAEGAGVGPHWCHWSSQGHRWSRAQMPRVRFQHLKWNRGLQSVIGGAVMGSRRGQRFETCIRFPFPGRQEQAVCLNNPSIKGCYHMLWCFAVAHSQSFSILFLPRGQRGADGRAQPGTAPPDPTSWQIPHQAPPASHSLSTPQPASSRPLPY